MSARNEDGGPAFPRPASEDTRGGTLPDGNYPERAQDGMTLRDYFAAKALGGMFANPGGPIQANGMSGWNYTNCTLPDLAIEAYRIADAMLEARK